MSGFAGWESSECQEILGLPAELQGGKEPLQVPKPISQEYGLEAPFSLPQKPLHLSITHQI